MLSLCSRHYNKKYMFSLFPELKAKNEDCLPTSVLLLRSGEHVVEFK
jgi:hypothetical protein